VRVDGLVVEISCDSTTRDAKGAVESGPSSLVDHDKAAHRERMIKHEQILDEGLVLVG
jgi:hypothetical protein